MRLIWWKRVFSDLLEAGIERHRAGHERELEIAFPVRARCHGSNSEGTSGNGQMSDFVPVNGADRGTLAQPRPLLWQERERHGQASFPFTSRSGISRRRRSRAAAAKVASAEYPRFVIQKHAATRLHYDLRLEVDGVFKSWAVTKGPSLDPKDKRLAVETEDHPLDYGDFEGTIPKGEYGGGTVMLWDRGFWATDGDAAKALRKGELRFTLVGEKLQGSWVLVRLRNDRERGKRTNWLLIKRHDGYEKEGDAEGILDQDRSVASGRSMDEIAAGKGRSPKAFMLGKAKQLQGECRLAFEPG